MSLVNFQVVVDGELTPIDRKMLVKIADIIEAGVTELEEKSSDLDYQQLLNFVMELNAEYKRYILIKISDRVQPPHISVIKAHLREKLATIKSKLAE